MPEMRFTVIVVLVGCGRLGFDERGTCTTCDAGLIGHWRLDEAAGSVAHDDLGGHDGAVLGVAVWTAGQVGGALELAGASDVEIDWDFTPLTANAVTVAMWVRPNEQRNFDRYIASSWYDPTSGPSGSFLIDAGPQGHGVRCSFQIGNAIVDALVPDGVTGSAWHHVACRYDGATLATFLDGAVGATSPASGGFRSTASWPLAFGASSMRTNHQNYFTGVIDDVRVYDRALSEGELAALAAQ